MITKTPWGFGSLSAFWLIISSSDFLSLPEIHVIRNHSNSEIISFYFFNQDFSLFPPKFYSPRRLNIQVHNLWAPALNTDVHCVHPLSAAAQGELVLDLGVMKTNGQGCKITFVVEMGI